MNALAIPRVTREVLAHWRDLILACRLSAKVIGTGSLSAILIMGSVGTGLMALVAPIDRRLQFYVYFLEMSVPLLTGLIVSYLLAPASDPVMELLLTYPRPLAFVRAVRLTVLVLETGVVMLILNLVFVLLINQLNVEVFWRLSRSWLSPTVCLVGIAALGALWGRRGEIGTVATLVVWAGSLFLVPTARSIPGLQPIHLFLTTVLWPTKTNLWLINRFVLLIIGIAFSVFALVSTRDDERTLGIG